MKLLETLSRPFRTNYTASGKVVTTDHYNISTERTSSRIDKAWIDNRELPPIPFVDCFSFYTTIGRVQNTVDGLVQDIINRDWYYDDADEKNPEAVKLMEEWEERFNLTKIFEDMVRNWAVCGVQILSTADWVPLQLSSLIAKVRDEFGQTKSYIRVTGGQEELIPAKGFIESGFIELDRQAWPIGLFYSLMSPFEDIDGRSGLPLLTLYRQSQQDNMKIHHKFASPKLTYVFPGVSQKVIDKDIAPLIEAHRPGNSMVLTADAEHKPEIISDNIDTNTRYADSLQLLIKEIDTGLQTSKNRLITEPSAMADAKESQKADDDRIMGIMEKLRRFINKEVVPRVTGLSEGDIEFKWGAKDTFDLEFPPALTQALEKGVISTGEAREMLLSHFRWEIPEVTDIDAIPQKPEPAEMPPQVTDQIEKLNEKIESHIIRKESVESQHNSTVLKNRLHVELDELQRAQGLNN